MPLLRGTPLQLSRRFLSQQQRRYASHHHPHHTEVVNESFGVRLYLLDIAGPRLTSMIQKGFYFTVATVPFAYLLYRATRSVEAGEEPYLTKVIRQYELWLDSWRDWNELHTKMVEQAGYDRLILQHSPPSKAVDIKFTEYDPPFCFANRCMC